MGSIHKRGNRWRIRWDLPPDPVTGRRRQSSATVAGSRRDAEKALALREAEILTGAWTDSRGLTLSQFADRWLPDVQRTVKPTTWRFYRSKVANLTSYLGDVRLSSIDAPRLNATYQRMLERRRV